MAWSFLPRHALVVEFLLECHSNRVPAPLDPVETANFRHPLMGAQRVVLRRCSLEFRYLMYLVRFALFDRNRPQLEGKCDPAGRRTRVNQSTGVRVLDCCCCC